jgi:hypothetical protein
MNTFQSLTLSEQQQLIQDNTILKRQLESTQREVRYLTEQRDRLQANLFELAKNGRHVETHTTHYITTSSDDSNESNGSFNQMFDQIFGKNFEKHFEKFR